jgi:hypothetical protein
MGYIPASRKNHEQQNRYRKSYTVRRILKYSLDKDPEEKKAISY